MTLHRPDVGIIRAACQRRNNGDLYIGRMVSSSTVLSRRIDPRGCVTHWESKNVGDATIGCIPRATRTLRKRQFFFGGGCASSLIACRGCHAVVESSSSKMEDKHRFRMVREQVAKEGPIRISLGATYKESCHGTSVCVFWLSSRRKGH